MLLERQFVMLSLCVRWFTAWDGFIS